MSRLLLTVFAIASFFSALAQEPIKDYNFRFKITNLTDTTDSVAYLANYFGAKQYYFDTATFSKDGVLLFSGKEIKGGIYSIILSDKKSYFEVVVNEPKIDMETQAGDFVKSMKVKVSEENKNFYNYLSFIDGQAKLAESLKKELAEAQESDKKAIESKLASVDETVMNYKNDFIATYPNLFISKVFKTSAEPEVPKFDEIADEDARQKARYKYFKAVYLKDVDFTDERMLRTPVFHNKLTYYVTKLVAQVPDSIIKEADMLCEKSKSNKEIFKYVVHTITSKYEDSKIMGMEAVTVHMGKNYYCPDKAWWLSEKKLQEFCKWVDHNEPLLIGKPAVDLILMDTAGKWHQLYAINQPFTVLYFWASDCGHCKKVTPKLKEFYDLYHSKGVEVFAVETNLETKEWKKYLRNNDMPWINVSDNPEINKNAQELILKGTTTLESLNFRDTYDIFSTPKIFLLDKDKKIIATKLMPEQMGEFIDHLIDEQNKSPQEKVK